MPSPVIVISHPQNSGALAHVIYPGLQKGHLLGVRITEPNIASVILPGLVGTLLGVPLCPPRAITELCVSFRYDHVM